ncbi:hypothetical protein [Mycobacterium deserti]|uniref:Uncharacterized protein n=1 Tax=Mycobacterium deserti TaxID=2978347 RepID=A0ABT2MFN3_9MYCO|nr:hypothetical protein [Mycobacterium deserti]MCT7661082.1 hypothetical protein [Mycobacterium deserti]
MVVFMVFLSSVAASRAANHLVRLLSFDAAEEFPGRAVQLNPASVANDPIFAEFESQLPHVSAGALALFRAAGIVGLTSSVSRGQTVRLTRDACGECTVGGEIAMPVPALICASIAWVSLQRAGLTALGGGVHHGGLA